MSIKLSGLISGMDTDSIVTELMKAERMKSTKIENKVTKLEWKQDKWKTLNSKIYSFYTDSLSKMRFKGSYNTKDVTSSDDSKVTVTADSTASVGTQTLKIKQLASAQYVTGTQVAADDNGKAIGRSTLLTDLGFSDADSNTIIIDGGTGQEFLEVGTDTTVGNFIDACKKAGVNATYDSTQKRFFLSSLSSGIANAFSLEATTADSLTNLGLTDITTTESDGKVTVDSGSLSHIDPSDSIIEYNGATLTGTTNTITANGLTFNLKGVTDGSSTEDISDDKVINLSVTNNTQAVYDMVKSFVTGYNELLKEMNNEYNADSAKGYDPLTDDEKEAMTDTQIEKWETKIKDSLLRRDDNLNSVINLMRTEMGGNVTVNDKSYSLSTFGIGTSSIYTEKGLLHIDGNSEDSSVSGTTDKLKKALSEDPDTVTSVLSTLAGNLYSSMTDKMKSSSIKSALNFYNDKEMTKTLKDYNSSLKTMETKLTTLENKYYKQFTAMESAMSKLNSQSSSLTSLLGGSS
ncbi:MAG: flagellar filament capping protein FliD [Herbinix sp.]|nr:flagellar filament capping protein FliD [Herbinix sp.]